MKIQIEYWLESKNFSTNIDKLFKESILCYKHGAYYASLLFSYLGFMAYTKELLIQSEKPEKIKESRWVKLQKELENEDNWEKSLFTHLMNNSNPIFNIKQDIRDQIKYWKNRRNDCAHYKNNEIEFHHTESFWSFLKSNLNHITVEGGVKSLTLKFKNHFDRSKTPQNKDYKFLIKEIEYSVKINEFNDFLNELDSFIEDNILNKVYNEILNISPDEYIKSLIKKIKTSSQYSKLGVKFVIEFPDKIHLFEYSETEIRELWFKKYFSNEDKIKLYSILLRNSLIPNEEKEEAFLHLFNEYKQSPYYYIRYEDNFIIHSFYDNDLKKIFFTRAFIDSSSNGYMFFNNKSDLIVIYLENFGFKKEIVNKFCELFIPKNHPYILKNSLIKLFEKKPDLLKSFQDIAKENNYTIPPLLEI